MYIKSNGLHYGHVCLGQSAFEKLDGTGCNQFQIQKNDIITTDIEIEYLIKINNTERAGGPNKAVAILTFSQPVVIDTSFRLVFASVRFT